ncbi:4-alpha-N-acetylgalactosaminyltransferase [compost metagenome]|uniref:glycosyltransferase n=1 Tax=Pedobacter ghigonis TaxID=2730403 RepID=UPI000FC2056C|nr:glycosyltransferase [Pedobacter ghigonis]
MNKIKIVHIIASLGKGGAERFVVDLCNELAKNDQNEVHLLSLAENEDSNSFINDVSDRVHYYSFNKKPGFSFQVILKLTRWLNAVKPDIVSTHTNSFEYAIPYRILNHVTKFFHTIHSTANTECTNSTVKNIRKLLYKNNWVVPVTISKNGSQTFKDYYQLNNDIIIENGRNSLKTTGNYNALVSEYKSQSSAFLLVHVGRISSEKNQQLLIESVQYFNQTEKQKCKLLIIGEVQNEALYDILQKKVDNDKFIAFLGAKDNIGDYLSVADAFCLSSDFEGMPISLIEALSVGCTSVCTPVGGIKNMIEHGVNGFLSVDNTVKSYYEALKTSMFFKNKESIKENSLNDFKSKYHISISATKYAAAYYNKLELIKH